LIGSDYSVISYFKLFKYIIYDIFDLIIFLYSLAGTGVLREVNIPEHLIKNFSGPWLHSAKWRSDFIYRGKTVAVIGNGASYSPSSHPSSPSTPPLPLSYRS